MDRVKRLRRVALLCCSFARNLAYYKSSRDGRQLKIQNEFWITVNNNFLDFCVLEWCKLFGDQKGKHHWKQNIDTSSFESEMLKALGISQVDWEKSLKSVRRYRDKFLAHLDSDEVMDIPDLNIPWLTVNYYHSCLASLLAEFHVLNNIPANLTTYYENCYTDAQVVFQQYS